MLQLCRTILSVAGETKAPIAIAVQESSRSCHEQAAADENELCTLRQVKRALEGSTLFLNLLLQQGDGIDQLLRTRWAPRYIDVHGDYLVHTLNQRVIIENAAGGCAGAHRDHPFWLRHLLPELPDHRRHLLRDAAGDNHQVRLAR